MTQPLTHSQVQDEIAKAKPASRYPVSLYLVSQPKVSLPAASACTGEVSHHTKLYYLDTEIQTIEQLVKLLQTSTTSQPTLWNPRLDRGTIDRYVASVGVTRLKPSQHTPDLTQSQIALRNLAKKLGYESPTDIAREYTPAELIAECSAEYGIDQDKLWAQYNAHLEIVQMTDELTTSLEGEITNV